MSMEEEYGLNCPSCGHGDTLDILVRLDGTEFGTFASYWNDECPCRCPKCEHTGVVKDFVIFDRDKPEEISNILEFSPR